MELLRFIHFGYSLMVVTFLLMVWVSLCGSLEVESIRYPPCHFNSLCSCSNGMPDLGIVRCQDIHLAKIPETVNISRVFMLHLENNGLKTIEPHFLRSTGLYKIVISRNPLSLIPDEAFLGLEKSLWELELSYNQLSYVPNRALRYLQRIRLLDLSGNEILKISPNNWRGMESSLATLILADNWITNLPADSFSSLPRLETLDLRGNNLKEIEPSVFRDGMEKLSHLILSDNQLSSIPYQALNHLKTLRILELSHNIIDQMRSASEIGGQTIHVNLQLNLNILKLDYNELSILETTAFQYFNVLNKTYMDGNPLSIVEENAFRPAKIRELYMRSCGLEKLSPLAFEGLENYLEILDLSGNSITVFPEEIFYNLKFLHTLSLRDNSINSLNATKFFSTVPLSLNQLDISGQEMVSVNIQDLRRMRNLRAISLSKLSQTTLSPQDFLEFGIDLEELEITFSNLNTIQNNAFKYVHSLKRLEFSEGHIGTIESFAFVEIGHSLKYLKLSHALSTSVQSMPADALRTLTHLEELDISNNRIKTMPDTSLHFLKNLKRLYLQDNVIEIVQKGTFQGDIHDELLDIHLSFNNIRTIQRHTFVNLKKVNQIHLDDNKIDKLETRCFMNLENLERLNLKGNKINSISREAFENLPQLEDLDLSFNKLVTLDLAIFDQVGTLAIFHVNISHNHLNELRNSVQVDFESQIGSGGLHSNIKVLDFSYNNITLIAKQFFKPIEPFLTHIYLHHNSLLNATKEVFGNMPQLQILDISHNILYELDFDTFRNTRKLQLLDVSHNRLAVIPNDIFKYLINLRIVDFSHNRLAYLPDNLFREGSLERLDVSHNMLYKLPLTSLSVATAVTICELDLSWNRISSLDHGGMLSRLKSLSWLNLSHNRLQQIDAGTFKGIPRLFSLDLGHNSQLKFEEDGLSFQGLEYTLLDLNLNNVSLAQFPILPTPHLIALSLAHNSLPTIYSEMLMNLTLLRRLNLNNNDFTKVPSITFSLCELRYLHMAANPITVITNQSLLDVADHLIELDLSDVDLNSFEAGALWKIHSLRTLKIELYKNVRNFNIPNLLRYNICLRNLEVNVGKNTENFEKAFLGEFPAKLRNVTFSGRGLKKLEPSILQGIRSPLLHLNLRNTSITKVPSSLFERATRARNVTIDVRNNPLLKTFQNPCTGVRPNLAKRTFLLDLQLSGSKWTCDCDLGWVEIWQRKRRQYLCPRSPSLSPSLHNFNYKCRYVDDDLRMTMCQNKNNQSFIEVLKTDIECGWGAATIPEYSLLNIGMILLCYLL